MTHLARVNADPRDAHIHFYAEGHRYEIDTDPGTKYTSVTTWVHEHFPAFDADAIIDKMMKSQKWHEGHAYWGMTKPQIKAQWAANGKSASEAGTAMHERIELFMNSTTLPTKYTHAQLLQVKKTFFFACLVLFGLRLVRPAALHGALRAVGRPLCGRPLRSPRGLLPCREIFGLIELVPDTEGARAASAKGVREAGDQPPEGRPKAPQVPQTIKPKKTLC